MFDLPKRLWEFLCIKSDILNTKPWAEVNNKQINNKPELFSILKHFLNYKLLFCKMLLIKIIYILLEKSCHKKF